MQDLDHIIEVNKQATEAGMPKPWRTPTNRYLATVHGYVHIIGKIDEWETQSPGQSPTYVQPASERGCDNTPQGREA